MDLDVTIKKNKKKKAHPSEANVNGDILSTGHRAVIHTYTHVSSIANVDRLLFVEDQFMSDEKSNERIRKRRRRRRRK